MPRPIKKKARKKEIGSEVELQGVLTDLRDTLKKKQRTVLIYGLIGLSAAAVLAVMGVSAAGEDAGAARRDRRLEPSRQEEGFEGSSGRRAARPNPI
mgnify:CR=1 FL=1